MVANRNGFFYVLDRTNGELIKELWRYQLGAPIYASPTTFMIDNRQYVMMPAGATLTAFALPR